MIIFFFADRSEAAMNVIMDVITILLEHWVLTTILTLTALLYWHYVANFSELKKLGFPGPTPWPILGNLVNVMSNKGLHIFLQIAKEKYGKVFGVYFLKYPSIVVHDPEILKCVLVKDFDKFQDRTVSSSSFFCLQWLKICSCTFLCLPSVLPPVWNSSPKPKNQHLILNSLL